MCLSWDRVFHLSSTSFPSSTFHQLGTLLFSLVIRQFELQSFTFARNCNCMLRCKACVCVFFRISLEALLLAPLLSYKLYPKFAYWEVMIYMANVRVCFIVQNCISKSFIEIHIVKVELITISQINWNLGNKFKISIRYKSNFSISIYRKYNKDFWNDIKLWKLYQNNRNAVLRIYSSLLIN